MSLSFTKLCELRFFEHYLLFSLIFIVIDISAYRFLLYNLDIVMIYFSVERRVSEMMVQITMTGFIGSDVGDHVPKAGIVIKLIIIYSLLISSHSMPVLEIRVLIVQFL